MALLNSPRSTPADRALTRAHHLPTVGTVVATAMVAAAALMPVIQSSIATTTGYETQKLEQHKLDLQAAIYEQQNEVAQLGAMERIDKEARGRLGMIPAQGGISIQVSRAPGATGSVPARYLPAPGAKPVPGSAGDQPTGFWAKLAALLPR